MKGGNRTRLPRVAEGIREELAELIARHVKDPRVGFVTITAVEVSRDLGHAKVFITLMGDTDADKVRANLHILNDASGYLRMLLGKVMKLRSVPQLHFHYDESISRGAHLSALIDQALAEDRRKQQDED